MKRFSVICVLLALALPGASAARPGAPGDGTLAVRGGVARIVIQVRGAVIGRLDHGSVTIKDPIADDGTGPIVNGYEVTKDINDTTTRWAGTNVRFRDIGGRFTLIVVGSGIDLAAVGKGNLTLLGDKNADDDGTFSVNGAAPQPILTVLQQFTFGTPPPG